VHDEYFQRLRPTTLGALLAELSARDESVYELGEGDARSVAASVRSARSVTPSVIQHSEAASPSAPAEQQGGHMLLLLDVRSPEAFDQWHIRGAVSYPPSQMIHANNPLPKDIYYYRAPRDSQHKMVVVYDDEGKSAALAAGNLLVQKGVENTYVVSGGLREFAPRFPHLLEGAVPALPPPPTPGAASLSSLARKGGPSTPSNRPPSTARTVNSTIAPSVKSHLTSASSRTAGGKALGGAWK
jgi:rhodanese-related sulfurtransferase